MDPRKKSDDLKAAQLAFLTSPFSTDAENMAAHAMGLRLTADSTEPSHTQAIRLTPLDISAHTSTGLRLSVANSTIGVQSQSHTGGLHLTDSSDGMHTVGLRLSDADAVVHATAMRLSEDSEALHRSALRLSDSDIPHSSGLRLPLSTPDYGLSSMYSMTSILSGSDVRSVIDLPKRDHYDIGLSSRGSSMRGFGVYNEDGRLPGISYMMSSQDSSMRAAGLDMTIPTLPVSVQTTSPSASPSLDSTPSSLITGQAFTVAAPSAHASLFSTRGYGISGNESDSDSELVAEAAAAHSNLTEAQERFASHLGRMDMKSIIEATKLAVAQQQINHLAPGPLDLKPHSQAHTDAKVLLLDRQFMRDAEVEALSRSLHSSAVGDHLNPSVSEHLPLDFKLTSHHHDHELSDMSHLTDSAHATDLTVTTTDLSCTQTAENTPDSPPSSPGKGKRLYDKRTIPSHWFHEFPWLLLDNVLNLFYCRYCVETGSDSIFSKGHSAAKVKREYFLKHEETEVHREASRKFLGIEAQENAEAIASSAQTMNLDAMSLTWSSAHMHPSTSDFDTLTTSSTITVNTGHDPGQKPTIIDSTNAHILNLVISPRTLTETRAQFEGWFDEFPWLVYDALLNVFLCKVCQQAGESNLLSAGKSSDQLERSQYEDHQALAIHQEAYKVLEDDPNDDGTKQAEAEADEETQTFRIRRIHLSWFLEFPWLELNQMDTCFYCKLCRLYKQPGIFSFGHPAGNPKKDFFHKHENMEGHKIASLQDAGISGEEAVRTVLEMINKENRDELGEGANDQDLDQAEIDVVTNKTAMQNIEMDLSKKATATVTVTDMAAEPNRLTLSLTGKSDLGRKIKLDWFIEFPWLELDENKSVFYCKLCRIYHPIGIYVSGKSAVNPRKDDLRKHEGTEGHKIAANSHTRAGAEGERRLENHSLDPSNAHLIDITTVSQITQAQNKSSQNISNFTTTTSCTSFTQTDEIPPSEDLDPLGPFSDTPSLTPLMPVASTSISTSLSCTAQSTTSITTPASDDWAIQFPWYTVESPSQTAYCKVCRAESLGNALAQGVPVYIVMKKDCIVHEIIEEHQKAVENALRAEAERELDEKRQEEEAAMLMQQAAAAIAAQQQQQQQQQQNQAQNTTTTPKQFNTTSPYIIKQTTLPPGAFSDTKSPWRSSFWQLANQMRHLGILCDVTISVGGMETQRFYHVHKLLLVCSSELFKTYLREDSLDNHYHFDNITSVGIEGILQYIYGQPLKGMTVEQSEQCCAAADVLIMPKAKELFQKSVISTMHGHKSKKKNAQLHSSNGNSAGVAATAATVATSVVEPVPLLTPLVAQPQQLLPIQSSPPTLAPPPDTTQTQQLLELPPASPQNLQAETTETATGMVLHSPDMASMTSVDIAPITVDVGIQQEETSFGSPLFDSGDETVGEIGVQQIVVQQITIQPQTQHDLPEEEEVIEGTLTEEEVKTRTVGQLAKKPNIIGRLRAKDRIKTYNSLRSITSKAKKGKNKKEVVVKDLTITPIIGKTMKEILNANSQLEDIVADKPAASLLQSELTPQFPSEPQPPKKGKKRTKKDKANDKAAKQQKISLEEVNMILQPDENRFIVSAKPDETDLLDLNNLNEFVVSDSEIEDGLVIDEDEVHDAIPLPQPALLPMHKNSNHKLNKKHQQQQNQQKTLATTVEEDHLPTCVDCGKKFLRPSFLARHREAKHKTSTLNITLNNVKNSTLSSESGVKEEGGSNGSSGGNHKCEVCGKGFSTRYDLKIHARRHTGERPYLCNVCGKSFTRRETLIEHSYIHKPDAEKPHRCKSCGKGFYKIYDLQRHFVGIHSGAKPFQCHLCGKSFPWARSLSDHLQSHKGADRLRPYKCEECDMTFRRKYDLERHKVKHAAQKPFVCDWCGHGFTQKGSMDKHKREFCHGRPGNASAANMTDNNGAVKQTRSSSANNLQTNSNDIDIKSDTEDKLESDLQATSELDVDDDVPTMLTLTTEQRTQTTDMFPSFSPDPEPGSATMLYYSI